MMLNPGVILQNRYQIIRSLGGGGMGDVYLAYDLHLYNRQVVVKENRGGDPQLFYAEANLLAALHHPNLPRVIDHFVEPQPPGGTGAQYLVMDHIAGETLEQIVQRRGALPEPEALAWFYQILDAVRYLHANHVIHRDIKPQNIIITPDGKAVLVDFGIAKVMQPGQATVSGARGFGSPGFAPPEQYTGGTDERSDVYSLGATLYFALTGLNPPSVPERAYGTQLTSVRSRNPTASANTESAILRATALAGNQRYQSVPEMEQALRIQPAKNGFQVPWIVVGVSIGVLVLLAVCLLLNGVMGTFYKQTPAVVAFATGTPTPMLTATAGATPIAAYTTTPNASEERTIGGAAMVDVPAGAFAMGSDDPSHAAENPVHTAYLDSFWIDKYLVTNAFYKKCVEAGKCRPPSATSSYMRDPYYENPEYDNYPVIHVSWDDANAFCAWDGKRLPSEAEWEKAARGTDGRVYPWGNTWDGARLNFCDKNCPFALKDSNADDGYADTSPVGNYRTGASPYGAMDMAGNVSQWVADWYDENYYAISPHDNPRGPSAGQYRVVRGGAWDSYQSEVRAAFRRSFTPDLRNNVVGFRCAQ